MGVAKPAIFSGPAHVCAIIEPMHESVARTDMSQRRPTAV